MDLLTADDIKYNYEKLQMQMRVYKENSEYVKGYNPEILREARKKDPDNRLPIPLAKSAVEDMTGYAGSKINVYYESVDVDASEDTNEDEYKEITRKFQNYNDDDIITTQLYQESISHIKAYLLMWVSDELGLDNGLMTAEYEVVGMDEMVIIEDYGLKPKMLAAIHYVSINKDDTANVYYPGEGGEDGFSQGWIKKEGTGKWIRHVEIDTVYPFQQVPVIAFSMSMNGGPLFQAEKPLIDKHDSVISKSQNEIDRFNALIALFPFKVNAEFIKKLEEKKAIDDLGQWEKWPEYLEKNLAGVTEYTNNHLDRLERLFHKTIKVVDFNQIAAAGGDESGVARAFKMLGMEFKATTIEKVFKKGFYKRAELFNDIINASTLNIDTDKYKTIVDAKRSLPIDELSKIQIAQGLNALGVSDETILKMLPETVIKDPEKELERMAEKKAERAAQFAGMLNKDNDDEE